MGEVYKARDTRIPRDVAIKTSNERFSDRFTLEARAIGALNHPNICTLYDVGPDYLVMELVDGSSPSGPMPEDEILRVAEQVAAALAFAHEKGIVHRDLKAANVKLTAEGTVKVLDFGLAKVMRDRSSETSTLTVHATQAGSVLGTPAYMAPEQAQGKEIDRRADVWAFGVLLHELIKTLPDAFGRDADRLARFEREAKLLVSPCWREGGPHNEELCQPRGRSSVLSSSCSGSRTAGYCEQPSA
jgi:serine/threonine protein kinase